jgi:hypothetical protein
MSGRHEMGSMATYRIMLNEPPILDTDQGYHQIGEMPWRLTAGSPRRIEGQSYLVERTTGNQGSQELTITVRWLGGPRQPSVREAAGWPEGEAP